MTNALSLLSRSVRDMERGRRGDTLNNNVFNDRKQRAQEHGYKWSDAHKWRLATDSKHGAEQTINRQS